MAAIYQWITTDEVVFTTTLYPAETQTGLSVTADIDVANLVEFPEDSMEMSMSLTGGSIYPALLYAPEQDGAVEMSMSVTGGSIYVGLTYAPEQDDSMEMSMSLVSGSLAAKLVTAYSPDHGLDISIDLDVSGTALNAV